MAKYDVTYTCGHTGVIQLIGPHSQREWRLERESGRLCPDCYAEELRKQREAENAKAAEAAKEQELPALTGTEKQIAWAETIRQKFLAELQIFVEKHVKPEKQTNSIVLNVVESFQKETSAHWWIDNGRLFGAFELRGIIEQRMKELKDRPTEAEINPAQVEATVRPESPVTETVAEIRVLDNSVEVVFPEKRNDFWQLIKPELKYEWHDKWQHKCRKPHDYAAQTGNALLNAGFIIRIYDPEIRKQAIDGTFKLEQTRVIMCRTNGDYAGWFVIQWNREKDDFYQAARKIRRSKYDKPYVIVPPEMYDEVLDFAQKYGFELSDGATRAAETARLTKEAALVTTAVKITPDAGIHPDNVPPVLTVPEEVDIDEELRDKN